jgi:hypothetical protein
MDELGLFTAALGLSGPWRVVRTAVLHLLSASTLILIGYP